VAISSSTGPIGYIRLADRPRPEATTAIAELHRLGLRTVMLTGDNAPTAASVASELGIADVRSGLLPGDKASIVSSLDRDHGPTGMIGDGVNDAPALAAADVGVAMGAGADVAIESAGITLLGGDLKGLVRARRLSRATLSNIRQNLAFAFGYNLLGVPLAAGVLYPAFGLMLSPMIAALAMSLSSVSVVANALRLRRLSL
jgi:Cu+-exporting ATPase